MATDILIVDDEADIRELVGGILEDEGYAVRTAKNADEAITAIQSRRPHLVLLDIWLEGSRLDGLALLVDAPYHPSPGARGFRLSEPDWLPALINAARAFLAVSALEFFWSRPPGQTAPRRSDS